MSEQMLILSSLHIRLVFFTAIKGQVFNQCQPSNAPRIKTLISRMLGSNLDS